MTIGSDSKGSVSSSSRWGIESGPHYFPYARRDFGSKDISLVDDLETKGVFGDSFSDRALSRDPLDVMFFGKTDRGENYAEKMFPPSVSTEAIIEVSRHVTP